MSIRRRLSYRDRRNGEIAVYYKGQALGHVKCDGGSMSLSTGRTRFDRWHAFDPDGAIIERAPSHPAIFKNRTAAAQTLYWRNYDSTKG